MNTYLNYLLEANLALLLFLAAYRLLLSRETKFHTMRIILLTGIFASVLFPLIHMENDQGTSALLLAHVIPTYWLPEVSVGSGGAEAVINTSLNFWHYTTAIYVTGLILGLVIILLQLIQLFKIIARSSTYPLKGLRIAESREDQPTFSFFHFIFIGQADRLTSAEKHQIIQHESVHVHQWHSFDILIINMLAILFWFNPIIRTFKKMFVQLHEFEADARAVENSDVNKYCNLLARVALQSADLTLANHFNNSLTVKRIEMMRTIKKRILPWKMVALATIISLSFFIVACHDQVLTEISDSTVTQTSDYPPAVKADMDAYKLKYPEAKLSYVEGLSTEVNTIINSEQASRMIVKSYELGVDKKGVLFSDLTTHAEALRSEDKVFTIVEEAASFAGGLPALMQHLRNNILYPESARKAGTNGTVYVGFVVNEDGHLTDYTIVKGIDPAIDAEALRAVKTFPPWNPGKQNGVAVRQRYVLPIAFNVDNGQNQQDTIAEDLYTMDVQFKKSATSQGTTLIEGTVTSRDTRKPLAGTNILISGTRSGTTADANGKFTLEIPKENSQLVFSFVGYEYKKIDL